MRNSISKTIVAGLAALAMSAAVVLPATPASAGQWMHGGGWGGGGWHGGGWGGGGWRGGGWHGGWGGGYGGWRGAGVGWRPGWGGGYWHRGYGNNGYWNNGWWGPAVVAGLAAGAVASYPWGYGYGYGYDNGYGYDDGCWAYRRVYDAYGHYLGRRYVNVC